MSLFQSLIACLGENERLRFELSRDHGQLAVLLQPILNAAPDAFSDEQQHIRAGLAHPLRITGNTTELDKSLLNQLAQYGEKRQALSAAAEELAVLEESLRQAQQALHKKRQQSAQPAKSQSTPTAMKPPSPTGEVPSAESKPDTTPVPSPTLSAATASNPDSLFSESMLSDLTITQPTRIFKMGSLELPDPAPDLTPNEAIKMLAVNFPPLSQGILGAPELRGDTLVYPLEKPPVKTNG